MKLLISFLMIFQMICTNIEFYGKSYIVYDSLNQCVVEGRNIDYLQSVASYRDETDTFFESFRFR